MPLPPCVNLRCLGHHLTGVQRYVLELLPHLAGQVEEVKPARSRQGIGGHVWEQFYLPWKTRGRLLWSPGNTGPLAVPHQVVTVHDASTLDHPEWFEGKFAEWYRFLLPRLMRRVRRVLTVSEFSRRRLIERAGLQEAAVVAIPNGVAERFHPAPASVVAEYRARMGLTTPYFLCVASLEPRKNLRRLFAAWKRLQPEGYELVIAGRAGHIFRDQGFVAPGDGVRLLGQVEDAELPWLLSGAEAFVFPSVYEGFGLPPLEAMACGCPVLSSHATSLPEVCGEEFRPGGEPSTGAALYFDPLQSEAIADSLRRFLALGRPERQLMVENGRRQAALFTWQAAAAKVWKVLEEEL